MQKPHHSTQWPPLPTLRSLLRAGGEPFISRDLSWLQFNERVLTEARQPETPALERLKFLSISSSNLDEFFMIRFASLGESISKLTDQAALSPSSKIHIRDYRRIMSAILTEANRLGGRQVRILEDLSDELKPLGVQIVRRRYFDPIEAELGKKLFDSQIVPHLAKPEPYRPKFIRTLGNLQLGAVFQNNDWIPLPKTLPAAYWAESQDKDTVYIYFLDDLIANHLGNHFNIQGPLGIVRLTRDADLTLEIDEEDAESLAELVKLGIGKRERRRAVRLQYSGSLPDFFLSDSAVTLNLQPGQIYLAPQTLCIHGLWGVVNQLSAASKVNPALIYPPHRTTVPIPLRTMEKIFERISEQDILLHHPYDSFDGFIQWIRAACADNQVIKIEMTVYRVDTLSPIIELLKKHARLKQIRVIIELRARFDEMNNVRLAKELTDSGIEVAFGFGKLKVHAKIALVTRIENNTTRHYTHLSTGNYNATTARQYTDLAILTANAEIGNDAKVFFDSLWKGEIPTSFKMLVSAPAKLHRKIIQLIKSEIVAAQGGKPARIVAKVNALVDESIIQALYLASNAGVKIDLNVRGPCALIPGIKGLSENIRVISIVDRFLEHSRLYYFESSKKLYLSSADWMPRNFFSRLELAYPVLDPRIYTFIKETVIPTYFSDTVKAKELTSKGTWRTVVRPHSALPLRAQQHFQDLAISEYKNTAMEAPPS